METLSGSAVTDRRLARTTSTAPTGDHPAFRSLAPHKRAGPSSEWASHRRRPVPPWRAPDGALRTSLNTGLPGVRRHRNAVLGATSFSSG